MLQCIDKIFELPSLYSLEAPGGYSEPDLELDTVVSSKQKVANTKGWLKSNP